MDEHEGVAAWVQAIGIITSFSIAIYFSREDARRRRAKERRQAATLISLLPILRDFQHELIDAAANPREAKTLELPNKVLRRAKDFQLVDGAAGYFNSLQDRLADLNNTIRDMQNAEPSDQGTKAEDVRNGLSEFHRTLELMMDEIKAMYS